MIYKKTFLMAAALLGATVAMAQTMPGEIAPRGSKVSQLPANELSDKKEGAGKKESEMGARDARFQDGVRRATKRDYGAIPPYGSAVFSGEFEQSSFHAFNPNYAIAVGDVLSVRIWGAINYADKLTVDAQGNVFVPQIGPVHVLGVPNSDVQKVFDNLTKRVFKSNVYVYANLEAAQPVKVFVTGGVASPGLYGGLSSDSVLFYLDKAGGIDPAKGSFIDIVVTRNGQPRITINLYDFLAQGSLPIVQLADGDVILVKPRQNVVTVTGSVVNTAKFEFASGDYTVDKLLALARPVAGASHFSVRRNQNGVRTVRHFPVAEAATVRLSDGDEVSVSTESLLDSVGVKIEMPGAFDRVVALKRGATLADVLAQAGQSPLSDFTAVQIMRQSVADRQKAALDLSLTKLEQTIFTAKSATSEEAAIRVREAEMFSKFIDRAREVKPKGQVVLSKGYDPASVLIEDGDTVVIPEKTSTVLVQGEVNFPAAMVFREGYSVSDYVADAGGFSQNAESGKVLIVRRSGVVVEGSAGVLPGDEIMVMPRVDSKNFETVRAITQIIYQIAVAARFVLNI